MTGRGKGNKEKPKTTTQSKLTDYGPHGSELLTLANKDANSISAEATPRSSNASPTNTGVTEDAVAMPNKDKQLCLVKDEILGEIRSLKTDFTGRFDGVMKAIEDTRREMSECTERVAEAEVRLSTVEDEQLELKAVIENLQKRNKQLEEKAVDLEMRSRLNNLRLVGLPEDSEGPDICEFLENWLPEALDLNPMRSPLVLERAHRIGPKRDADAPPRTVIMRFLNYKHKEKVLRAARLKNDILFKNQRVKLYADVATEMHQQRKEFDVVREQLRQLRVRHGILAPCTLILTYEGKVHKFNSPAEAKVFIKKIQKDTEERD